MKGHIRKRGQNSYAVVLDLVRDASRAKAGARCSTAVVSSMFTS